MVERHSRLTELDVLRGLAVAGMIVVTSPGDWNRAYWPLKHADWNGWTAADMVFPTFLFSVGMALGLSFPHAIVTKADRDRLWLRIGRRTVALIALGLALNAIYVMTISAGAPAPGHGGLANIRIPGVPQRIGLCYLFAAALVLATARKDARTFYSVNGPAIFRVIVTVLVLYFLAITFVPVPGYGAGHLDPEGSLPAYIDRAIFTVPHLWQFGFKVWAGPVIYDPEGLLSTLPATTNVLFGVLAARAWRLAPERAVPRIAVAGALLILVGLLFDPLTPINKRLWTSSFALLSSGVSALGLSSFALLLRSKIADPLLTPLKVLGGNAVLAFTISILWGYFYGWPLLHRDGALVSPQKWIDDLVLRILPNAYLASLTCALGVLAVITILILPLHRRAIHFRL